jgi:heme/copper-type cytochrome/quinol oxidase subunit 1
MIAIGFLGFIVWGHHMFVSGMSLTLSATFSVSTMVIAVPSAIKTFNWMGTIWRGSIEFTTSMCFALAFVSMFVIGGLSGIFMASTPVDLFVHHTYFIVAHFHYVLFGGSIFAIFGAIYFWFPKMFERMLNETLGKWHFFLTLVFFNLTFFPMHNLGLGGMMRRIADPNGSRALAPTPASQPALHRWRNRPWFHHLPLYLECRHQPQERQKLLTVRRHAEHSRMDCCIASRAWQLRQDTCGLPRTLRIQRSRHRQGLPAPGRARA